MAILFNPACHSCSCVGTVRTFIGGEFTSVGGTARLSIAKLNGDGTLTTAWSADLSASIGTATIKSMVLDGSTLYVGGLFDTIGGTARECLAALDVTTGTVLSWSADLSTTAGDEATALLLVGTDLYVGGTFTSLGGVAIECLAHDSGIIYFGGTFSTVDGGTARNSLAAMSTAGVLQSWNPNAATGIVRTMAIDSGIVYLGGRFTSISGSTRNNAAAYSTAGVLQSWNPDINGINEQIRTLAIADSIVYLGGTYNSVGGTTRNHLAALHTDGTLQSWDPSVTPNNGAGASNGVYQLFVRDGNVYCTGQCSAVGGITRNDAFVISTSGTLADWNANLAGGSPTGESIIAAE
jgi:hypothetical protein